MKIAIVDPTSCDKPYDGLALQTTSLGASWTSVIHLARELHRLGHEMLVLNHNPNPGDYDGVQYLTGRIPEDIYEQEHVKQALEGTEALIVNRAGPIDWHDILEKIGVVGYRKYLWCHDAGGAQHGQPEKFAVYDRVVSVSNWLNQRNIDANYELEPDYFTAIPLGVDTNLFKPGDPNRFDICFVGAWVSTRRPQLAIQAFTAACRARPDLDFRLHLIGSAAVWGGPPEGANDQNTINFRSMVQSAMDEAKALGVGEQIIQYSDIPNLKVAEILPMMGMMVYPTITETCGVGILEAQAAGVPVIVPDDCMDTAVGERVYHTETGIVRHFGRLDEVAQSMIDMATNDHVYQKVRDQARAKVVRENDWQAIAKRWETEVLNARPAIQVIEERETMKTKKIGVGILSWQNRPMLEKCVESLKANAGMDIEIVVWDNASRASGSDNVEWLGLNHSDIMIMEQDENRHCTISRNGVIEHFRTQRPDIEYMLFTDMDVIFKPGFLFPMVEIMEQYDDCAIVAYDEANCGFRPDDRGRVSEVMSICNLHRLSSFDVFENPDRPFDERFKVYSFDSWVCQTLNLEKWYTYLVRGRRGYDHIGGQIDKFLADSDAIKRADVELWQSMADKMAVRKPWEHKNAADYISIGNRLKDDKDVDAALHEYLVGISRYPDDATLHFCMGNLLKDQGKFVQAVEAYNNALAKNPRAHNVIWAKEEAHRQIN